MNDTMTALNDTQQESADQEEQVGGFEDAVESESATPSIEDIISRLSSIESKAQELDSIKHNVQSQLGRVQGIQSKVDKLANDEASAIYRARVERLEESLASLNDLLMGSDLIDDQVKLSMRERQLEQRLRALETPAQPQRQPEAEVSPEVAALWSDATSEVIRIANELSFDPANIPQDVWSAGVSTGSPFKAINYVSEWIKSQTKETDMVARAAEKKRAANNGSVPRAGSTPSVEDLVRAYGEGRDITAEEKRRVMKHLGLSK